MLSISKVKIYNVIPYREERLGNLDVGGRMMNVIFQFDDTDMDEVSGFELGDIIITKGDLRCTSLNRKPDQSMMLFLTIPDLLNQIKEMIESRKEEIMIMGVDSSYLLKITYKKDMYSISDDKCVIKGIEQKELLDSVYQAARCIWDKYGKHVISDSVRYDFCDALTNYKELLYEDS